ncbi:MAG: DUF2971 domain-containing protein [Anaerolineaceae bacterium]|nr:DUF2971 domain-containing protein [Anaerolineaceae bacterium]
MIEISPVVAICNQQLAGLGRNLIDSLQRNASVQKILTMQGEKISNAEFNGWKSKREIDYIDVEVGTLYVLTDREIDHVLNYEIKFRSGQDIIYSFSGNALVSPVNLTYAQSECWRVTMKIIVDDDPLHPETFLYHYTSPAGFMGIVDSKKIWASNVEYLNDSEELKHAIWIILEFIEMFEETLTTSSERAFVGELYKRLNQIVKRKSNYGIYTVSFSTEPDKLSQWRGYCQNANGVSIGLDFNSPLYDITKDQGFSLVRCEYTEEGKIPPKFIQDFLTGRINRFEKLKRLRFKERAEKALENIEIEFIRLAPRIKHPSFSEECEWRLVSDIIPDTSPEIRFRSGNTMLIPYVEIKLTNDDNDPLNIPEVWLGPNQNHELAAQSIRNYLNHKEVFAFAYQDSFGPTPFDIDNPIDPNIKVETPVKSSSSPYRIA